MTTAGHRAPRLLHDLLASAAARFPERPAIVTALRRVTYAELAAATDRAAVALAGRGVRRGDRVLVTAADPIRVGAALYAVSRLGAAFSVLHEEVRGKPLEHVLHDSEPALIVTDDPAACRTAQQAGTACLPLDELLPADGAADTAPDSDTAPDPDTAPDTHAASGTHGAATTLPDPGTLAVDPACLIYTSGTTSLPKAVVSTHQQMLFAVDAIAACLDYRADDVVYCPLPLSFDYGLYQLFLTTLCGGQLRMATQAEAGPPLLKSLAASGATVLAGVPSVTDRLAWLAQRSRDRVPKGAPAPAGVPGGGRGPALLDGLRLLTNTGAALSAQTMATLRAAVPGLRVQVMYGLTECKRAAIMPPDGDLERPGSSGRPLPGTEMYVIDDDGHRLPPGEIGQFVVRGPHVMAGYWRRPELTAERFHRADGLFPELRTGDYGWLDEDGFLYFSGRRDDLYKERGFRVSTTEVEAAARRVPGVSEAAVLAPEGGSSALLAVVSEQSADEVLARMRDEIEPFKIPRRCLRLPRLPVNGNGKVDRKQLRALVTADAGAATPG